MVSRQARLLAGRVLLGVIAATFGCGSLPAETLNAWAKDLDRRTRESLETDGLLTASMQDIERLSSASSRSVPRFASDGVYFLARQSGEEQAALYVSESLDAPNPQKLVDPAAFDPDGHAAIASYRVAPGGGKVAYAVQRYGSDWVDVRVFDRHKGGEVGEPIKNVKLTAGGFTWDRKGEGIFFTAFEAPKPDRRYSAPDSIQAVFYRSLSDPGARELVFESPEYTVRATPRLMSDGRLMLHLVRSTRGDMVLWCSRDSRKCRPESSVGDFSYHLRISGERNGRILAVTDRIAPRSRLVSIDPDDPEPDSWKEILAESAETLVWAREIGEKIVAVTLDEGQTRLRLHEVGERTAREVPLPNFGSLSGITANDGRLYYKFSSHVDPPRLYSVSLRDGRGAAVRGYLQGESESLSTFVTTRHLVPAADGARLPVFVTHSADWRSDAGTRALMEGYGGWHKNMTPRYSPLTAAWLEDGGIFITAQLRGGGEKGRDWHRAGTHENKPTVFSDFAAVARYLIAERMTSAETLAITGLSNGGLLTAASMIRNPDLFGAVVIRAGALDLLNIERHTIARFTMPPELGSAGYPAEREVLASYSPQQTITEGMRFPPVLIMTGEYDDRVVPEQAFAFSRRLVALGDSDRNVHLTIIEDTGHSDGFAHSKDVEWRALELAFLRKTIASDRVGPGDNIKNAGRK